MVHRQETLISTFSEDDLLSHPPQGDRRKRLGVFVFRFVRRQVAWISTFSEDDLGTFLDLEPSLYDQI